MPEVRLDVPPEDYAKVVYAAAVHGLKRSEVWAILLAGMFYDMSAADVAETVNVALGSKEGEHGDKSSPA